VSKGLQKKTSPHQLLDAPVDDSGKRVPPPHVVTILRSMSVDKDTGELEPATKTFRDVLEKAGKESQADQDAKRRGTTAFADIKWWQVIEEPVASIEDMYDLVDKWSRDTQAALLHGGFIGLEAAIAGRDEKGKPLTRWDGMTRKMLDTFRERDLYYIILDADHYEPKDPETIGEPVEMAEDWISNTLPGSMHDVSYIFQLSSSAYVHDWLGRQDPARVGKLDAHFVFMLESPVHLSELRAWAKSLKAAGAEVDISTVHATQVAYIARPRFAGMIQDPLPEGRIRLVSKSRPAVPASTFAIFADQPTTRAATPGQACATTAATAPSIKAPTSAPRVRALEARTTPTKVTGIGWPAAVNLAYPIDILLGDILAERYRRVEGSDRRLDFLRSITASLGSAYTKPGLLTGPGLATDIVREDWLIGSLSGSDRCSLYGPWAAWDLIRDERYGDLDDGATWVKESDRPSYKKMLTWAKADEMSGIASKLILKHLNAKDKEAIPYPTYQDVVAEYNRQAAIRFAKAHPSIAMAVGA
jgi:hypothetical protein